MDKVVKAVESAWNIDVIVNEVVDGDGPAVLADVAEVVEALLAAGEFAEVDLAEGYWVIAIFVVEADEFVLNDFLIMQCFYDWSDILRGSKTKHAIFWEASRRLYHVHG